MAFPQFTLAGKNALVSGSSRGIGAAIATALFERGANVAINYPPDPKQKANAEELAQKLMSSINTVNGTSNGASSSNLTARRAVAIEADIASVAGPRHLATSAYEALGKIDILVNCAGQHRPFEMHDEMNDDDFIANVWDKVLNLNARGVVLLTRATLPFLADRNARIVNIGSTVSRDPDPMMTVYGGSKGMVEAMTRCWASELPLKHIGLTVNCVAPGATLTDAIREVPDPRFLEWLGGRCKVETPIKDEHGDGRFGKPEEIAWAVAMLCEPGASWINGAWIPVSGGMTIV